MLSLTKIVQTGSTAGKSMGTIILAIACPDYRGYKYIL